MADQQAIFDAYEERSILFDQVDDVPALGSMSGMLLFKETAFPVLVSTEGTQVIGAAAGSMGEGRVFAFGHDAYLSPDVLDHPSICQLLKNAIQWVGNTEEIFVLTRDSPDLADYLSNQNIQVRDLSWDEQISEDILNEVNVVMLSAHHISQENGELESIQSFLQSGGGGIFAGLGWAWQDENPDKSLHSDFSGNQLLAEAGMSWDYSTIPEQYSFNTQVEISPLVSFQGAKEYMLENEYFSADKSEYAQALRTVLNSLKFVKEEPFAIPSDFPGDVPEDAVTQPKRLTIKANSPFWNSTGLYAPAGQQINITVEKELKARGVTIRIGAHTDLLYELEDWQRIPEISVAFELKDGSNTVFTPFGGLIYIDVPENYEGDDIKLLITGGIPAPYFKLGATSLKDWKKTIRNYPSPWGEIESEDMVLTLQSSHLRELDNPDEVAALWDKIQNANKDLVGWDENKSHKMRIAFDKQISMGCMHSGYPVMAYIGNDEANAIDVNQIDKWGFVHELGHNHQQEVWTFEETWEVTCNLFSLYALETTFGVGDVMGALTEEGRVDMWNSYLDNNKSFKFWGDEPFLALSMYVQLKDVYGWEAYQNVFRAYQNLPPEELPQDEAGKRDTWLKMFSETVGEDLSDFFDAWNVPVSEEAKESLKHLPMADINLLMGALQ